MLKILTICIAAVLILSGLIIFPMPIPLGAIMIAAGIVLLISASASVAIWLRSFRGRHKKTDQVIRSAEEKLPRSLKRILKRTDPP